MHNVERTAYLVVSGKVIAHLREQRKVSQAKLGAEIGLSQYAMSRIESGISHVDTTTWENIARSLSLEPQALQNIVDQAYSRTHQVIINLMGSGVLSPWERLVASAGMVGLQGLAMFAVAETLAGFSRKGNA